MRNQVFISYSHKDKRWLVELKKYLTPLLRDHPIDVWEDTQLRAGERWLDSIENALASAKLAVLLVSANYLASDFIASREMPPILASQSAKGLRLIWERNRITLFSELSIVMRFDEPSVPNAIVIPVSISK